MPKTSAAPDESLFLAWLSDNGVRWDASALDILASRGASCPGGRPLYWVRALRTLKVGEAVVHIPKNSILTMRTCMLSTAIRDADLQGPLGLTVALMGERCLREASRFWGYLQVLPFSEPLPITWTEEERRGLKGTDYEAFADMDADLGLMKEDFYSEVKPLLDRAGIGMEVVHKEALAALTLDDFVAAATVVASRSFRVDEYHGQGLVPVADIFNHKSGGEHVHLEGESESEDDDDNDDDDEEVLGKRGDDGEGRSEGSEGLSTLSMCVIRSVDKDCEVFNTFGDLSNAALLNKYGFVEMGNPHNEVTLSRTETLRAVACAGGSKCEEALERWARRSLKVPKRWKAAAARLQEREDERGEDDSEEESDEEDQEDSKDDYSFNIDPDGRVDEDLVLLVSLIAVASQDVASKVSCSYDDFVHELTGEGTQKNGRAFGANSVEAAVLAQVRDLITAIADARESHYGEGTSLEADEAEYRRLRSALDASKGKGDSAGGGPDPLDVDNLHVHEQRLLACLILRIEERRALVKCRQMHRKRTQTMVEGEDEDKENHKEKEKDGHESEDEDEYEGMNELERARMMHQERNREYLRRLGISGAAHEITPQRKHQKVHRQLKSVDVREASRKSGRLAGAQAEYTAGDLVDDDDLWDDEGGDERGDSTMVESPRKRQKKAVRYDAALENAQRWLEENRAALMRHQAADSKDPSSQDPWKEEAVRRWGDRVGANASVCDWEGYVRSRMSQPLPVSPDPLLQEYYSFDAWRLLCACALMSRVSSANTKHTCISAFFEKFPTPSALLDAGPDDVLPTVLPLGLFPTRYKTVVEVSRRFIEMPAFEVGKAPELKIYGVGEFTLDSYRIFVKGDVDFAPGDKNLKAFVSWQKRHRAGKQPPAASE